MRISPIALLLVIVVAGCGDAHSEQRKLERAEESLEDAREEARQRIAEAREEAEEQLGRARDRVTDARERVREAAGDLEDERERWTEESWREADEALEDVGLSEIFGKVMEDVGLALQGEADVEVVDGNVLQDLLPERVEGFRKYNSDSGTTDRWGFHLGQSEAKYRNDDGDHMKVTLVDVGTLRGALSRSGEWMDSAVQHRSDDHFRRSTRINGHPAYVKISKGYNDRAQLQATVVVAERFLIRIEARGNVADSDLHEEVVDAIGTRRLERLAS